MIDLVFHDYNKRVINKSAPKLWGYWRKEFKALLSADSITKLAITIQTSERVLLNTVKNTREQIYLKIQGFQQQRITNY